jgi:cobalt-precorrin 5A hydrolase
MGVDQAMTARLAIGVGCRKDCPAEAIVALVGEARSAVGTGREAALYTLADKRHEPGLRSAAERLGLDLVFLSGDALQAVMPGVVTRSAAAEARFGVASVAEAAALAGAGPGARLLLARIAGGGATCAIAATPEEAE